jgi:uncharacterized repeat protein (TIGR02543 family)
MRRFVMKNKCVFSGFLLIIIGELFMLGIVGCDNGTTTTTITQYTVTFNANGGQVSPGTMTVEEGKTIDVLPTPTKTSGDTVFQWWYTKNGTDNDWGIPFTDLTPIVADITVYAKWGSIAPTKCTITFDPEGGTVNPASIQVNSGDRAGTLPIPTKNNNTFKGWWTGQNGTGTLFNETTTVSGNITVYAKWERIVAKSNPIQVYSTNDGSTVYSGRDFDLYFDGDSKKDIVAEIRSGKVTFFYSEVPAALLQTVTAGQNGISAVNPSGAKASLHGLKLKFDNGEELALQKDGSEDGVGIIYADKDVSVTYTFDMDSSPVTMNLKKGWNFVLGTV